MINPYGYISTNDCLKKFKGHSDMITSIIVLSDKIFVSASREVKFWNIDKDKCVKSVAVEG